MDINTINYFYNGKLWKPSLTVPDKNSFFHSIFGTRCDKEDAYFDKHAKFRRMRWSTFLTYFANEVMPSSLTDTLMKCLNEKCISIEDDEAFAKYVTEITTVEPPVNIAEIPILSALENVNVAVLSDKETDPVIVIKANAEILGNYPHVLDKPNEAVLCLKGDVFSRLNPVDEDTEASNKTDDVLLPECGALRRIAECRNSSTKFKTGGGNAGSRGVEFQVNLLTVFLLNSLQKLQNWKISSENKRAGKFDDVVVELSDKSVILLQAKYKENRKITFDQLLSVHSKNDDFSLPKYFFSYEKIKTEFKIKNIIICTNTYVDAKSLKCLHRQDVCSDSMLHYEDGSCSFFIFSEEILPLLKENVKIYYANNLRGTAIDETVITDDNIKDFLKNLHFYINYPPGKSLERVVEHLLFQMKYSNTLWDKTSHQDLHHKVKDWFQQSCGMKEYLTYIRAKAIFCEIRSDKYREMLEQYNVTFDRNDLIFTDLKRIHYVIAEDGHLLHAIKIYRVLRNNKIKTLYVNPDDGIDVQKHVIEAFALSFYTMLVIVWSKIEKESLASQVCEELKKILEKSKYKKVILICQSKERPSQQTILDENCCRTINRSVTFEDLSKDTQKRLLRKKNVNYQGNEVNLEELFVDKTIECCEKAIYPEILEKLVRGENIKVGSKLQPLDEHVARYYIEREFIRKTNARNEIYSVEEICEVNDKVVIISDSAGMGKTTVLTKLATVIKKKYPRLWVVRIELSNYCGVLKDILRANRDSINLTELLDYKKSTRITSEFETFLFSMKENVVLMLDGVDEISPDYTGLIVSLVSQCQEASNIAKIFITTRPHIALDLEENFHVKPFILQPFTNQNQIDFLTNYWMHTLKLYDTNKTRCEDYAKALINKMSSWVKLYRHKQNHFAAIPLQVRMLAEIFQDNHSLEMPTEWKGCKEYLISDDQEPKLPEKVNITKLYDMFIKKKRDIFIDKENPNGKIASNQALLHEFEECLIFHRTLAIKIILDENKHRLFSHHQEFDCDIEVNILKVGIVQQSIKKLYFVHRTFAEYFVAETLLVELQHENQNVELQKFFIDEILSNLEYNVVRSFFDSRLQNMIDFLPINLFQNYQSLKYNISLDMKWKYNLIHRLAEEGCTYIIKLILKCLQLQVDEDNENDVLDFYENNFDKQNPKQLLGNTLYVLQSFIARYGINIKDEKCRIPLHYACQNGHLELVKYLVEQGAGIDSRDSGDFTPLREAVKNGHFDVVKFLMEKGADVTDKDRLGRTIIYEAIIGNSRRIVKHILESILKTDEVITTDLMIPYAAAYLGELDILKDLIGKGLDINARIHNEESLIFAATRGGQHATIEYLVRQNADVNSKDDDGNTCICLAASKGELDTVQFLVECGANVNVQNNDGRTALHTAASWGQCDTVEFLVSQRADVNIKDSDGYTPLFLAAEEGFVDTIKFLVDNGAHVNIRGNDKRTALFLAAEEGELETVKLLVRYGAYINYKDSEDCTALFLAAEEGELDIVKYLVECGADINVRNKDGHTALHLAISTSHNLDIIRFLLEYGASVNIKDGSGRTTIFYAIKQGHLDIVQVLARFGADINDQDNNKCTVLHLATFRRLPDIIKFLVECGAEVNAQDSNGWTVLHLATYWGHLDIIKFLVRYGADVNIKGKDGRTPLFLAVKEGQLDVIRFFLKQRSLNLNDTDSYGRTALHYAASFGVETVVKCLVEEGADISCKDSNGNTPADLARIKGHQPLLKYLEQEKEQLTPLQYLCFECLK